MRQSSPIADYVDRLAQELSFDRVLSRRVRAEVEDHLRQAAIDAPGGPSAETERRAIVTFGEPRALARQYAAASLLTQMRRVGAIMVLALAGVFAAMEGRVAWYKLVQWQVNDTAKAANAIGLPLDRSAFMLAMGIALIGCCYIATRRAPAEFHRAYGQELRRCLLLCGAATAALLMAIATETVLNGFRLLGAEPSAAMAIPASTLAAEIAAAVVLILRLRATLRRMAAASSLLLAETAPSSSRRLVL